MGYRIKVVVVGFVVLAASAAWAGHPLITDDAGTQGKGKFQLEITGQYDTDKENVDGVSTESTGSQVATALSYGLVENVDLVLGLPYQWAKGKEDGVTLFDEKGISDMTLDLKWRFFEKAGLSLALKPGVRLPTGKDEKGLGAGRTGYQAFLIGSQEAAPWAFHANLGYIGNENKVDEERHLWHASLALTCEIVKGFTAVGNIGIEKNRDRTADKNPAFLLGGFIYSLGENVDLDIGLKYGLTAAETDWSFLVGTAFRF